MLLLRLVAAVLLLAVAGPAPAAADDPEGVWPLHPQPEVVGGFDPPDVPWGRGHRGVDLAASVGQPVRAALPGTVSFAGRIAGRGVVVVDHGARRTTYEPVTATVRRGTVVSGGDVIGTVAFFGSHCLPRACLHWGLRRGEDYLDPLQLVGGPREVRLLPLGPSPVGVASAPTRPVPATAPPRLAAVPTTTWLPPTWALPLVLVL